MKPILALRRETVGRVLLCVTRGLFAALLSGGRMLGGYAPFCVGAVAAAGPGWEGLAALAGMICGSLAFLDFPHALRTVACGVLIFTANNAFCELRAYRKPWFLPLLTATLCLTVEAIYLYRSGSVAEAAYGVVAIALSALYAGCCRAAVYQKGGETGRMIDTKPVESLVVLLGVLSAFSAPQLRSGFAPGRIGAVLAVLFIAFDRSLAAALASALCVGLAMDLTAPENSFRFAACYGLCALLACLLRRQSRVRAAMAFLMGTALFALSTGGREGLMLLYENTAGALAFLLLPSQLLRSIHGEQAPEDESTDSALRRRLSEAAGALRELYHNITHVEPVPAENPAVIYDRAAEAVCRDCTLRERCWVNEYNRTYTALCDATPALLRNGQGRGEDFPSYFADRCVRFTSFLGAVNTELSAFLLRRQYRLRLDAAYARSAGQYAQLSELLSQAAARPAGMGLAPAPLLTYQLARKLRPKEGESFSGDSAGSFETESGELCLLLSDGMGSGEAARRESAMAVHLIERFLRAGIDASSALRTLNSAFALRAESAESFTTVDLLTLSLKSGEGELYKYGAAPTYIKRDGRVWRVGCSCLPAGLAGDETPPETTHIRLDGGSFLIMVTDGVADATDDEWLQQLLTDWDGEDPQQLVSAILADSYEHRGAGDDAGVLALYLPRWEDPATEV